MVPRGTAPPKPRRDSPAAPAEAAGPSRETGRCRRALQTPRPRSDQKSAVGRRFQSGMMPSIVVT